MTPNMDHNLPKDNVIFVHLLRLGDIISCLPLLSTLFNRRSESKLHLLINDQFSQVKHISPSFINMLTFPRRELQELYRSGQYNCLEIHSLLKTRLTQLKSLVGEPVNLAVNLTNNLLSGHLLSMLAPRHYLGLSINSSGKKGIYNKWFIYLNQLGNHPVENVFHYLDIYKNALGLERIEMDGAVEISTTARQRANQIMIECGFANHSPLLGLQVFSSDPKKNWPQKSIVSLLKLVKKKYPDALLALLGAPWEQHQLEEISRTQSNTVVICQDLAVTAVILEKFQVLITPDTAIKHLAAILPSGPAILEIAQGPASPTQMGPYGHGHVILAPELTCYPCGHSSLCDSNPTLLCGEYVKPQRVVDVLALLVAGEKIEPASKDGVNLMVSCIDNQGNYFLNGKGDNYQKWLERRRLWEDKLVKTAVSNRH